MSHTTIIHVYPGEKVENGEELRNSYGSAPIVWDYLIKKHINPYATMMNEKAIDELWKLWKNPKVPIHQRAVLMMTFDRAYVSKDYYRRAAQDIRMFLRDNPTFGVVNHWYHILDIFESDPNIPAIGLWCTSVSVNPFWGDYDDEKEQYQPPNWNECHDIYKELDGLQNPPEG